MQCLKSFEMNFQICSVIKCEFKQDFVVEFLVRAGFGERICSVIKCEFKQDFVVEFLVRAGFGKRMETLVVVVIILRLGLLVDWLIGCFRRNESINQSSARLNGVMTSFEISVFPTKTDNSTTNTHKFTVWQSSSELIWRVDVSWMSFSKKRSTESGFPFDFGVL